MKHYIISIILLSITGFLQAQTLSEAKILYSKGEYKKALPTFKESLNTKPNDASLNLWYGVCLLETGQPEVALSHLKEAEKRRLPEADRYLAKYYFKASAPDTALIFIDKYLKNIKVSEEKKQTGLTLKTSIESCIEQLQRVEDVCFIDSIILPKSKLFSSIKLSVEAGSIKLAHDTFAEASLSSGYAFFPERNDRVFYASKFSGKGLDIVARHRILNDWGDVEPLPDIINSNADECNPYFLSDGVTLYFASNGHGSIGGYDLFVTRLNKTNNTFLQPSHLNMPFNSTANDYFLIVDELANRGYLATDRNLPDGYVAIYTFIPSQTRTLLQGKSFKELQDFAQIRSIKATQVGKNLDSLLQKAPVEILPAKEEEPDIIFTINDSLQYSKESDFKSNDARQQFIVYRSQYQKYTKAKKFLEEKREHYLQATPVSQNNIGAEIIKLEAEVLKAQRELPSMEKRVRNLEIAKLSQ
jgi:tetratricopeptide (TPR) repeat protein